MLPDRSQRDVPPWNQPVTPTEGSPGQSGPTEGIDDKKVLDDAAIQGVLEAVGKAAANLSGPGLKKSGPTAPTNPVAAEAIFKEARRLLRLIEAQKGAQEPNK